MQNINFLKFLKETPKNLWSIIVIWAMAIAGIVVITASWDTFDPAWTAWGSVIFLLLIMYLAVLRVWRIWKSL